MSRLSLKPVCVPGALRAGQGCCGCSTPAKGAERVGALSPSGTPPTPRLLSMPGAGQLGWVPGEGGAPRCPARLARRPGGRPGDALAELLQPPAGKTHLSGLGGGREAAPAEAIPAAISDNKALY